MTESSTVTYWLCLYLSVLGSGKPSRLQVMCGVGRPRARHLGEIHEGGRKILGREGWYLRERGGPGCKVWPEKVDRRRGLASAKQNTA